MKSISTEGGVGGRVLLLRDGWGVVVIVNTTSYWSFYSILQTILIGHGLMLLWFADLIFAFA